MIYHVQWRRPGGSWKWLTGWGLMEDRDLPAEDARKMTRSEAEAAVRNLTSGPKNVRGEDIQYEARVVPQGGSGSPTRGRGAGLFVVRSNSGKVVGRYHTKAEAEHRVQQLKAGAARLKPFQFASGHSSQSPDGHRQNRRWGPCSHCGASGWDVIGQRVSGLFDHDRPDGRHCVAAARNLERAHLLNPVQSEGSSRAIRSMGAAMISSGNGCAP